jgi:hypothetical protein
MSGCVCRSEVAMIGDGGCRLGIDAGWGRVVGLALFAWRTAPAGRLSCLGPILSLFCRADRDFNSTGIWPLSGVRRGRMSLRYDGN